MIGLHCPKCRSKLLTVKQTREGEESKRRERQCYKCDTRFWTVERVEAEGHEP